MKQIHNQLTKLNGFIKFMVLLEETHLAHEFVNEFLIESGELCWNLRYMFFPLGSTVKHLSVIKLRICSFGKCCKISECDKLRIC